MKSKKPERIAASRRPEVFRKTTWSKVKAGAVVLMAWLRGKRDLVEVTITERHTERSDYDGSHWIIASYSYAGEHYPNRSFPPRRVIYARAKS